MIQYAFLPAVSSRLQTTLQIDTAAARTRSGWSLSRPPPLTAWIQKRVAKQRCALSVMNAGDAHTRVRIAAQWFDSQRKGSWAGMDGSFCESDVVRASTVLHLEILSSSSSSSSQLREHHCWPGRIHECFLSFCLTKLVLPQHTRCGETNPTHTHTHSCQRRSIWVSLVTLQVIRYTWKLTAFIFHHTLSHVNTDSNNTSHLLFELL